MNLPGAEEDDVDKDIEYVEIRLQATQLSQIASLPGIDVEVITPEKVRAKPRPFAVPTNLRRSFGYTEKYQEHFTDEGVVAAVDHGEFKQCVDSLVANCKKTDAGGDNVPVLCLQRCRRGGKTFMAHAVASQLETRFKKDGSSPFVLYITLNNNSKFHRDENAKEAILSRVAYELQQPEQDFYLFRKTYSSFDAVDSWVSANNVILLIDELNAITPGVPGYEGMSEFLDLLVSRRGSSLLYTTHHRIKEDLLRGRDDDDDLRCVSMRPHVWQAMPRIKTTACMKNLGKQEQAFWSAVLRGRIPALLVLDDIAGFMPVHDLDSATRLIMFDAILCGDITKLQSGRNLFRSYSYLLKETDDSSVYVWPPFLCAQEAVLGKKNQCTLLRTVLQAPDVNPSKAFENLCELGVFLQLMANDRTAADSLVPRHSGVQPGNAYNVTHILEVSTDPDGNECRDIPSLRREVERLYRDNHRYASMLQAVVVPTITEFPIYDFFVFHRRKRDLPGFSKFVVAAGYQCKYGSEYPDEQHKALSVVGKSIWIEGKGPLTRRKPKSFGWTLLSGKQVEELLGMSLYAALPSNAVANLSLPVRLPSGTCSV